MNHEPNEKPVLTRRFVQLHSFMAMWKSLSLTDADLLEFESLLMKDSKSSPVIQGTGGLRKTRFTPARLNQGKSGGYRITYLDIEEEFLVILIVVFNKSEKANLTKSERNELQELVKILKSHYGGNKNG